MPINLLLQERVFPPYDQERQRYAIKVVAQRNSKDIIEGMRTNRHYRLVAMFPSISDNVGDEFFRLTQHSGWGRLGLSTVTSKSLHKQFIKYHLKVYLK